MIGKALLAYVILERLAELVIAARNTKALRARGAVEAGAGHYPVMVALHLSWTFAVLGWFVLKQPDANRFFVSAYMLVQVLRIWVMASLGRYWTTRIISVPDAPLIVSGPYRFMPHPNYVVVTLEVALLPLVFGAYHIAAVFTVLNAAMLYVRIGAENAALKARR